MTITEGEQLKMDGMSANLAAADSIVRPFRWYAEKALAECVKAKRPFTADDVWQRIPQGIEPHHPNVLASVIGRASQNGDIVEIDRPRKSNRRSRHASTNRVWIAATEGEVAA